VRCDFTQLQRTKFKLPAPQQLRDYSMWTTIGIFLIIGGCLGLCWVFKDDGDPDYGHEDFDIGGPKDPIKKIHLVDDDRNP